MRLISASEPQICTNIITQIPAVDPTALFLPIHLAFLHLSLFGHPALAGTVLSRVGFPPIRNLAVSLAVPVAFLVGAGALPAGLGIMGEHGSFALGITLYGVLLLGGVVLLRYLRFHENIEQRVHNEIFSESVALTP